MRGKAEEIRQMAELYAKPSYQPAPKESIREAIAQCRLFNDHHAHAAEEAEDLPRLHREQHQAIP